MPAKVVHINGSALIVDPVQHAALPVHIERIVSTPLALETMDTAYRWSMGYGPKIIPPEASNFLLKSFR